ncbi:MAG: Hsp33 family molecular chaperone HslO [Myxococcales bacterium]|nr:Hsp33 family molecular chaperone HslO [Myxococcales bacterium]
MSEKSTDRVIRAMTQDGQFRVIAVTLGDTAAEAAVRQKAPDDLVKRLAELMCAGVLLRETVQPTNRVQVIFKDSLGHRLVTDSLPEGSNRSIVDPGKETAAVSEEGIYQVAYTLRNGELHQGIVAVADDIDVSRAVMRYLQDSEQITAFVKISTQESCASSRAVGGFVVQVTPEVTREGLEAMTSHLETYTGMPGWLAGEHHPALLIDELLRDHEYTILADSDLRFGCTCSQERMLIGLSTLPKSEIGEILAEGEGIELDCNACGQKYQVSTDELATLLLPTSDPKTPPN